MSIHEVSKLAGVSVRTLHHYDAIGLLPPTTLTEAGYRLYDDMQSSFLLWLFSNNYHAGDRIATSCVESYQKVIISVFFVYGVADFEPHYQLIDMVLFVCSCS